MPRKIFWVSYRHPHPIRFRSLQIGKFRTSNPTRIRKAGYTDRSKNRYRTGYIYELKR